MRLHATLWVVLLLMMLLLLLPRLVREDGLGKG